MKFIKKLKIRKVFFFSILALCIGIFSFWYFSKSASAAWFDDNWLYRKAITVTVTSSSSDITNLETLVTVDTSTSGKFQASCQDLRFTNISGKPLPYYIDSGCGTSSTKVWVLVDLVPKNTTTYNMYMYYGNPSATSASDSTKFRLFNGLVGYWTMNETSWAGVAGEVKDSSVNGNHGQAVGNATTTSSGKYSYAGTFDGDGDYVDVGNGASLTMNTAFTYVAWFKPNNVSNYQILFGYGQGIGCSGACANTGDVRIQNNNLDAYWHGSGAVNGGRLGTTTLSTGTWYQVVVVVVSGQYPVIYLNGITEGTTTGTAQTFAGTGWKAWIGKGLYNDPAQTFTGSIDDARIYNRALSASEISLLYNNPGNIASYGTAISQPTTSAGSEEKGPGPVGYWKFDDAQGTTAQDSSSSNNDGTISGATWTTEDQCVSGKCLKFDGSNDYVDAGDINTPIEGQNNFTISFWVKPNDVTYLTLNALMGTHAGSDYNTGWDIDINGSAAGSVNFVADDVAGSPWGMTYPALMNLQANQWVYLTLTRSGSTFQWYKNGQVFGASTSNSITIGAGASNLQIGSSGSERYLKGFIDEVKIYPYARTSAQIKADYNSRGSQIGTSVQIGPQNQWLSQGLVGYWKMDETSWSGVAGEVIDSSGNGNNGVRAGSATTGTGKFGNGGSFNSGTSDYVSVTENASLDITNAITIAVWAKGSASNTGVRNIISKSPFEYTTGYELRYSASNVLSITFGDSVNMNYQTVAYTQDTNWHHYIASYDGHRKRIYVDGVLIYQDSSDTSFTIATNALDLWIGEGRRNPGKWDGSIDEARIYNRALSPKEVSDLYNFAPGPVVQLKMDESSGITANDTSGYAHSGTLNGNPLWAPGKYGAGIKLDGTGDNVSVSDFSY